MSAVPTSAHRTRAWLAIPFLVIVALQSAPRVGAQADDGIFIQTLNAFDILYVLSGGGGNSLALMGDDGVVLIDSKESTQTTQMLHVIRGISDKPVTTIINTHAHPDHVGGNINIPTATSIVTHSRTRAAMEQMPMFQGQNARFLPTETMSDTMSLLDGPDRIDLHHFGPGHTDGDLVVVFPEKGTAYLGDLFPSKGVPLIDRANGGSLLALPATLARIVSELTGIRQVVPGHEPPTVGLIGADKPGAAMPMTVTFRWEDLEEYAGFVTDFVAAVQSAREAGQSVAEATASLSLPDQYQSYDMQNAPAAIEALYAEMAGR